jgi:hypothetical protein
MKRVFVAVMLVLASCLASTRNASAAPPWAERTDTLPRHVWAFDFGLGIGHAPAGNNNDITGAGINLEGAVGVIERLELGLRTGARFGDDGKAVQADNYGRLFDRQTYNTDGETFANPEFRIRGNLVRESVFELSLEGRAVFPFEDHTRFVPVFGVPLRFHFGIVRIDTGVWLPIYSFYDNPPFVVSAPLDVWFQINDKLWLGPMTGLTFYHQTVTVDPGPPRITQTIDRQDLSLGFGLGYQIAQAVDFKTMFLFPGINHDRGASTFGLGAGVQVRIE